jgi:hypothetical protein
MRPTGRESDLREDHPVRDQILRSHAVGGAPGVQLSAEVPGLVEHLLPLRRVFAQREELHCQRRGHILASRSAGGCAEQRLLRANLRFW